MINMISQHHSFFIKVVEALFENYNIKQITKCNVCGQINIRVDIDEIRCSKCHEMIAK